MVFFFIFYFFFFFPFLSRKFSYFSHYFRSPPTTKTAYTAWLLWDWTTVWAPIVWPWSAFIAFLTLWTSLFSKLPVCLKWKSGLILAMVANMMSLFSPFPFPSSLLPSPFSLLPPQLFSPLLSSSCPFLFADAIQWCATFLLWKCIKTLGLNSPTSRFVSFYSYAFLNFFSLSYFFFFF